MPNQIVHVPADTGPAYWGPGDRYTFLITGEQSDGSYFTMEAWIPPGGGPPAHIHHHEEEQFYILAGEVTLQVGDHTVRASVGDFVHVPRGTVHAFRNAGETPAKMLVTYAPAVIEKLFQEVFVRAEDRSMPPPPPTEAAMARFVAAAAKYGLETLLLSGPDSDEPRGNREPKHE